MDPQLAWIFIPTIQPALGGLAVGGESPGGDPPMTVKELFYLILRNREIHIDMLTTFSAVLLVFLAVLGSRRRSTGSKALLLPLWAAYTISYSIVSYTIGLVQSMEYRESIQLLWAVGLLLLLGSADTISAFSRHDVEQSKGMQAQHVVQTLLVLWLLLSSGTLSVESRQGLGPSVFTLTLYFLLCWIYSIFKMAQRIKAMRMASSGHGLVRSAKVVADYMLSTVKAEATGGHGPTDMTGCKYLVLGEQEHFSPPTEPPYLTKVAVGGEGDEIKVVTIDLIWKHSGDLLTSEDKRCALKNTCLSFALFKLLKRRFAGLDIAEAGDPKTMAFVLDGLLAETDNANPEGYKQAFRVVEGELSFMYDFFYTKYPALFPANKVLGVVRFFVLVGLLKVLYDFVLDAYRLTSDESLAVYYIFTSFNNILFVVMILTVDVVQQVATRYSNWAVVHFVCGYVRNKSRCWRWDCGLHQALIKWVANRRARKSRHWGNMLGQYSLLKSMDYHPYIGNALSWLSLRMMEPSGHGRRLETAVKLSDDVKETVLRSLKNSRGCVSNGRSSVLRSGMESDLRWACELPTHAHTVLVWHIATTMCDLEDITTDKSDRRLVATTLSGYCAYLLAFVPEMLPDHSYKAKQILDAVLQEAQRHLGTTDNICRKMLALGAEAQHGDSVGILTLGAKLGSQLVSVDKPARWELLAGLWAELLLFLAPSNNTDVHAEYLARGGEFITHLWALLTHAGILERGHFLAPAV